MVSNLADLEKLSPKPATLFFSMEPPLNLRIDGINTSGKNQEDGWRVRLRNRLSDICHSEQLRACYIPSQERVKQRLPILKLRK